MLTVDVVCPLPYCDAPAFADTDSVVIEDRFGDIRWDQTCADGHRCSVVLKASTEEADDAER